MKRKAKYRQMAVVELNNSGTEVYLFESNEPITMDTIIDFLSDGKGLDEERNSIMLVDEVIKKNLTPKAK